VTGAAVVLALEEHLAGDARARREEPHHGQDRRRLAASRLADEAEPLAAGEVEADALDGVQLAAVLQVEPDVQGVDAE